LHLPAFITGRVSVGSFTSSGPIKMLAESLRRREEARSGGEGEGQQGADGGAAVVAPDELIQIYLVSY
jgi:hypothetical protein